jgi:histidine ammonia-lyase
VITLDRSPLTLAQIHAVAHDFEPVSVSVSENAYRAVDESRRIVQKILAEHRVVYGINTGFGRLSDVKISDDELRDLQLNLVRSHSVGVGQPLSIPETRAMMLLRANVLAQGFSGARREVLDYLVGMLNDRVHPVIPSKGSVGASGDLAPLAHLALAMIGEGEVWETGEFRPGNPPSPTPSPFGKGEGAPIPTSPKLRHSSLATCSSFADFNDPTNPSIQQGAFFEEVDRWNSNHFDSDRA